jgi:hypothetical protein
MTAIAGAFDASEEERVLTEVERRVRHRRDYIPPFFRTGDSLQSTLEAFLKRPDWSPPSEDSA